MKLAKGPVNSKTDHYKFSQRRIKENINSFRTPLSGPIYKLWDFQKNQREVIEEPIYRMSEKLPDWRMWNRLVKSEGHHTRDKTPSENFICIWLWYFMFYVMLSIFSIIFCIAVHAMWFAPILFWSPMRNLKTERQRGCGYPGAGCWTPWFPVWWICPFYHDTTSWSCASLPVLEEVQVTTICTDSLLWEVCYNGNPSCCPS